VKKDNAVNHLRSLIGLPCRDARPGEMTYECAIDDPCDACEVRAEIEDALDAVLSGGDG
jgi:hypothetical protein